MTGRVVERARRSEVAPEDALFVRARYDYADAFEIQLSERDTRTPKQVFRSALKEGHPGLRTVPIVHRHVLRFRLGPLSSPDHLIGWRVVASEPDVVHLEAVGSLMRGNIVCRKVPPSTVVFTTFVSYVRRVPARIVWALLGPLHRRIVPHLLERGASACDSSG